MFELARDPSVNISDDAETNLRAYLRASSTSSIDGYKERSQRVWSGGNYHSKQDCRKKTKKTMEVDGLMILKPVSGQLTDAVNYHK